MGNNLFKRIIRKLANRKITSEEYISMLQRRGIRVGEGTRIFDPEQTTIDVQNPHMLKIGNNVFSGMYAIILKGTTIGDNVIIGAGSVVNGRVESNSVYAGVPAKKMVLLNSLVTKRRKGWFF